MDYTDTSPVSEQETLLTPAQRLTILTTAAHAFSQLISLNAAPKKSNIDYRIRLENEKLAIINQVYNLAIGTDHAITAHNRTAPRPTLGKIIKIVFGYVYTFFGPFLSAVGGFWGFKTILSLIMHIPNPAAIGIAIVSGVFEGFLSLWKEKNDIEMLTGSAFYKANPLIDIYNKQLNYIEALTKSLLNHSSYSKFSVKEYSHFKAVINLFHLDLVNKNEQLKFCHKETLSRKILKAIIGSIDAALYIGSGYILGKITLGLISTALLASPIGIGICSSIAFISLIAFYFLKQSQISVVVDNIVGDPKNLKSRQDNYIKQPDCMSKYNREINFIIEAKVKQVQMRQCFKMQALKKKNDLLYNRKQIKPLPKSIKKEFILNRQPARFFQATKNSPKIDPQINEREYSPDSNKVKL